MIKFIVAAILLLSSISMAQHFDYDSLETQRRIEELEKWKQQEEYYRQKQWHALERERLRREQQMSIEGVERSSYQAAQSAKYLAPAIKGKPFAIAGVIFLCLAALFTPIIIIGATG